MSVAESVPTGLVLPVPVQIDAAHEVESWDVVVGSGMAGGCAALEAARAGARVLVLERAAVHGGTTSTAGGHFDLGAGTAVQEATGHVALVEEMHPLPGRQRQDPRARRGSRPLRGLRRARRLARGTRPRVRAQLLPARGRRPAAGRVRGHGATNLLVDDDDESTVVGVRWRSNDQQGDDRAAAVVAAAGACATSIALDGAGYCSATQLGKGSCFGRRAGSAAAARAGSAVATAPPSEGRSR